MLSEKSFFYMSRYYTYSDKFCLSPYHWNSRLGQLEWTRSTRKLTFFAFVLLYFTLDCIYLCFVIYHIRNDTNVKVAVKIKVYMHCFTRLIALGMAYFMLIIRAELSNVNNRIVYSHRKFQSKFIHSHVKSNTNECKFLR